MKGAREMLGHTLWTCCSFIGVQSIFT